MKTYEQFRQQLQEMEYQAPPKPVPKAPIERKAQQPETRKAPTAKKQPPHPEVRRTYKKTQIGPDSKIKSPFKTHTDKGTEEAAIPGLGLVGVGVRRAMKKGKKGKTKKPYQM